MFGAFDRSLLALTAVVVVLLTASMAAVVILGVFFRYVIEDSLPWSEEAARYIMIWLSWLGGGLALRRGGHIAVDVMVNALPPALRRMVVIAAQLLTIGFLTLVLVYSIELTRGVSMQSTIGLGVSMQVPYAAMPIGTALMLYHALVLMLLGPSSEPKIETHVT